MLDHSSISVHHIHVRLHQHHMVFYQFPQYLIILMKIMLSLQLISYRCIFQMAVWPDKHIHVCRCRKNHHSSIQFCKRLDNLLDYHAILLMVHLHPILYRRNQNNLKFKLNAGLMIFLELPVHANPSKLFLFAPAQKSWVLCTPVFKNVDVTCEFFDSEWIETKWPSSLWHFASASNHVTSSPKAIWQAPSIETHPWAHGTCLPRLSSILFGS